jgi:DNA-binding transcriptional MerR regulator
MLQIGRFARLAGLSVGSLRHNDELDLLRPARIEPTTGYRFYRRAQLDAARQIALLRDPDDREILEGDVATLPEAADVLP